MILYDIYKKMIFLSLQNYEIDKIFLQASQQANFRNIDFSHYSNMVLK